MTSSTIVFVVAGLLSPPALANEDAETSSFRLHRGFRVERIYAVPRDSRGSWVALAVDDQGRVIASDQTGGLYRITLGKGGGADVQSLDLPIGHAHGLLYAFDSLYAVVAEEKHEGPGLYRIQDTDDDDRFDRVRLLQSFRGTGEHGPHSVVLAPDKKSLFVIAGNKTDVPATALEHSRVPRHWGEDDLLPRIWGPIGSEAGTPAPGGWIASTDAEGKMWRLRAIGLRNAFDLAFNKDGELFTVDADAEFDLGTPWYQPTRVFHVVDGTDYGWRSGSGKWPPYYPDTMPPVIELGPGSPTGVTFGHGAKFPVRYRDMLYVGDWSHGRIVGVHLEPHGTTHRGAVEVIVSGTPLPVTDLIVHPDDGAIYFTLGGRGTTSGLYRLSWIGDDSAGVSVAGGPASEGSVTRSLDTEMATINEIWPHLGSRDRTTQHRARIALEHVPPADWQEKALADEIPTLRLTALLALARCGDPSVRPRMIDALIGLNWEELDHDQRVTLLRCMEMTFVRWGSRDEVMSINVETCLQTRRFLESRFPSGDLTLDIQMCRLLIFLDSPRVPRIVTGLIEDAVIPQQQLAFAIELRHQRSGWTDDERQYFFSFLGGAARWRGGLSLTRYIEQIGKDALANVPESERDEVASLLKPARIDEPTLKIDRSFVREWKLSDLESLSPETIVRGDTEAGRRLFAAAQCFACHRFRDEGGAVGPDLTAVAKRMNTRDLLESLIEPNRVISDQFAASTILTSDGKVVTGRVVNLAGGALLVQTDMLNPSKLERIPEVDIEAMHQARTSMMPTGLLNTFSREEIIDLLSFLRERG